MRNNMNGNFLVVFGAFNRKSIQRTLTHALNKNGWNIDQIALANEVVPTEKERKQQRNNLLGSKFNGKENKSLFGQRKQADRIAD